MVVFSTPIKAKRRISFYQVKIMLPCGSGRKNSGACSLNLEREVGIFQWQRQRRNANFNQQKLVFY